MIFKIIFSLSFTSLLAAIIILGFINEVISKYDKI